jgi:hypothetical protein
MDNINAPIKAGRNPFILKPLTMAAASHNIKALIIRVKRPNVRIVIGKVSKSRIGFNVTLIIPSIIATISAVQKLDMVMPGTISAMSKITRALINQRNIKFIFYTFLINNG